MDTVMRMMRSGLPGGRRPVMLGISGDAPSEEEVRRLEKVIWSEAHGAGPLPADLGVVGDGVRSAPLALTQLILLFDVLQAREQLGG